MNSTKKLLLKIMLFCIVLTGITFTSQKASASEEDFVIEDGVLKEYKGNDRVITIPNHISTIGNKAFYNYDRLNSVTILDGVINIEDDAFKYCENLINIRIPASVTKIGSNVFDNCNNLTIFCHKDSSAETYLKNSNYNYVIIETGEEANKKQHTENNIIGNNATSDDVMKKAIINSITNQLLGEDEIKEIFFQDFDRNGRKEAFILTGREEEDPFEDCENTLWFAYYENGKVKTAVLKKEVRIISHLLELKSVTLFCAANFLATSSPEDIYCVEGNRVIKLFEGDSTTALNEDSFSSIHSTYDIGKDGSGHTWKPYYFYYEDGNIYEYEGQEISQSQFNQYENAEEMIKQYKKKGTIKSIIYRSNDMIHVNYIKDNTNTNVTYKVVDNKLTAPVEDEGIYLTEMPTDYYGSTYEVVYDDIYGSNLNYSYDYNDSDYDDNEDYYDYNDYDYEEDYNDSDNHTTTITKTIKPKVTKKKIKQLCKELTDWAGYKVIYKLKKGEKCTYSMAPKMRKEIIKHNRQYINACYYDVINGKYSTNNYFWDQISLQLFGKKTSNVQEPFAGDWGDQILTLKMKIKKYKKNNYKVITNMYIYYETLSKQKKLGNMTIYLKKNKKSSYGVAITKIVMERKK